MPVCCLAQTQNVLTLDQALNRARLRAPALLSAKARIEEARGRLKGASILLQSNPAIEGAVGPRFSNQGRTTEADILATQEFEALGRRSARIAAAQTGVTTEVAASRETARGLLRDVAVAFMRALAANQKIKVLTAAEQVTSSFLETAERRYQAGDIPIIEVNLAKNSAARARAELRSGHAELVNSLGELRVLLGMPPEEEIMVSGDLTRPRKYELSELMRTAEDRPDIRVLESELEGASADVRLGNTFKSPDFGLAARYERDQGDNIVQGGIRITLPIFSRGQELTATGSARANRIRGELAAIKSSIRSDIKAAFDAYAYRTEALQELERLALPSLAENENLARRSYEEGEIGLAELLLIRREILDTRLA
ncbi:MAG TPA: TolC family protein, partial [Terriglobales bacterium]|nr:TolC family protein [Terriglobales bacterium]